MNASTTFTAMRALIRKDLVLYFSSRRSLIMSIAAPIVIAAFFGSVFGTGNDRPSKIPVAVTDLDGSAVSKKIVAALQADPTLDVQVADDAAALGLVRKGKVRASLVLPAAFGEQAPRAMLGGGAKPAIDVRFDPSQSTVLAIVRGVLSQHVMDTLGRSMLGESASQAAGGAGGGRSFSLPFDLHASQTTSGIDRKYNGYAHSFAGMGVQFILFMGVEVGVGVLLARRLGLWKRLRAAPLSRSVLLGSHILSGALIAFVLMCIIYTAAVLGFGVRIEGSVAGFFGIVAAFSLLTSSFGLLIAALGKTPEATRSLAIFATLVMVMLGGAWVPSFMFPQWVQTATLAVPTRWAVDGLDAMTWRGLGFDSAAPAIAALLAFSALFAAIAIWRFDWEEPRG
jgi:ABC-2 type transport system permease protein